MEFFGGDMSDKARCYCGREVINSRCAGCGEFVYNCPCKTEQQMLRSWREKVKE
jgi:hypothetical protein